MSERDNKDLKRIEAFRKELKSDPSSLVFVALAETLNRMGRFDEAVDVANTGIRIHLDSVGGRLALAVARAGQHDIKAALEQIKAALTIDEENPRALALMGSLLLEKGLAHRAVQFLQQAVKLTPGRSEYQDLLRRAKRLSKSGSNIQLPKISMDENSGGEHPWSDSAEIPVPSESSSSIYEGLGTEFDADNTMLESDASATVDQAKIADLLGTNKSAAIESTQYASIEDMLGSSKNSDGEDLSQSSTFEYNVEARVGGSAAEPQHPLTQGAIPEAVDDSEFRTRAINKPESLLKAQASSSSGAKSEKEDASSRMVRPSVEAPSVRRAKQTSEKSEKPRSTSASPISAPKSKDPKVRKLTPLAREKAKAPTSEFEEPSPPLPEERQISSAEEDNRPKTMFVDDAVWAIYGTERPDAKPDTDSSASTASKSTKKKADKGKSAPASSDRRRSVLVVRTSKIFGRLTNGLFAALFLGLALWFGFTTASKRFGAAPSSSAEDIRGIVSDIDRGSLSSLRNALDAVSELSSTLPEADNSLRGVLAEIHSLLWTKFGQAQADHDKALAELEIIKEERASLEVIHARLLLGSSSNDYVTLEKELVAQAQEHPFSVKVLLLQADLASKLGKSKAVIQYLIRAYRIAPENRNVLLALARWSGEQENYRIMIRHLENVLKQDEYRDDIEALLNYVVVAHMLEEDSLVSRMQSRLVGVVRDEGTVIANDEIGRASLVFAVMNLMSNDLVQAGENLSSAESTYPNSIPFKLSVGMCLQLIGEFSRSKKQFEQVLKMDSRNVTALLGMGRAQYAKLVNLKSSKVRRGKSNRPSSWAVTSLGRAELTFSSFSRVHVQMNNTIFPEEAYLEASKLHQGEKLSNELKYINFVHAARSMFATGKVGLAKKYFEEALKLTQRPEVLSALGTVLLQTKRYLPALKSFDAALAMDDSLIEARLGKARVLVNQEKPLKAIELLKAIQDDVGLVPEATLLNARLQAERGNDRGELDLLQTLSENLTDSPELWLRIGRSLHANEESEQAVEAYRRALDLQSRLRARPATKKRRRKETRTAVDFLYLGRILSKDSAVRAKQMFLASVDLQGTPTESHYFLGKLLLKNGASRRAGKRSLKLYLRKAPKGDYAADVKKLIRRR